MDLHGRSLLKETDLNAQEFLFLVEEARRLRADKRQGVTGRQLAGRNIALIFEKTSTRARSAFEVAAHDEGGHVTYLGPGESQLGHKESVKDTARVLGRMFDGIEYRGFTQQSIETLGEFAGVPVWNGLTDTWHPTQMLADILTMTDHSGKALTEMSFCYLGDGRNNTANSLLVTGATLGMDARICAPAALQPSAGIRGIAAGLAAGSGARLLVTEDINTGVAGVDFVYTDVWLSLGEPEDQWGSAHQVHRAQLRPGRSAGAGRAPGVDHRRRRAPLAARGGLAQATGAGGDRDGALPGRRRRARGLRWRRRRTGGPIERR